uniref:Endoribonuclease n=1 Tax=Trichuris muris TaxID=70415 RepID=A0A5S6QQV6_TRIMR
MNKHGTCTANKCSRMVAFKRWIPHSVVILVCVLLVWKGQLAECLREVSDKDISKIMEMLQMADVNAAGPNDTAFNYQKHRSKGSAIEKFIPFVSRSYLAKPTVAALVNLMNMYEPQVGAPERTGTFKQQKIDHFLDEVLKTEVMKLLKQFLRWCGLIAASSDVNFKKWMKDLWFAEYARRRKAVDSSAFEHVFMGEIEGDKVLGLHNWIRFGYLEAKGVLDYKGFIMERQDSVATIEFTWNGKNKPVGGMLLGSSPEFDMAAATICSLLRPGANKCKFFYKNCEVIFDSHDIARHGKKFLSTSFPKAGKSCRHSTALKQTQKRPSNSTTDAA